MLKPLKLVRIGKNFPPQNSGDVSRSPGESGFTIIESLVGIVVVAVLLSAIAPVIILSVATRIQARRIEVASQAAKTYIDGVRSGSILSPDSTGSLTTTTSAFAAPTSTGTLTCSSVSYCTAPVTTSGERRLYCVDNDGISGCATNSKSDMIIQAVRYNSTSNDPAAGFALGIRVYRADAFKDNGALRKNQPTRITQRPFTGGVGATKVPLLETTVEVTYSSTGFDSLCSRLGGGSCQ